MAAIEEMTANARYFNLCGLVRVTTYQKMSSGDFHLRKLKPLYLRTFCWILVGGSLTLDLAALCGVQSRIEQKPAPQHGMHVMLR
jgi:hypothetical protein